MTAHYDKIGIVGAMAVEVETLKAAMEKEGAVKAIDVCGMTFCSGVLKGQAVVVVQCGVGMVNAATCTQTLVGRLDCDAIINTGVAGSLDAVINIGDIVVGTDAVNHVMDVANLGYEPGHTPDLGVRFFPTDEPLADIICSVSDRLGVATHRGRIASGDRFVREAEDKARIVELFDALCCEMEGAAIAQVCWLNKVPCALVRAISDKADGSASVDYPAFEAKAAHDCAGIVMGLLERMGR
ncbi:MAG: 5'-methylthioadenosine/adenosylhomocysteine nucleosidase [Coriobacteriia bacterium]|nr:5'-methylthioadenosine/adenosylhomocysteine nucleosidase [Coriobacteriia bacterium]